MASEILPISEAILNSPDVIRLDEALERSATIQGWQSASGLRMMRAVSSEGEIWGIGIGQQIDTALIHLGRDYRFGHVPSAYGEEGIYVPPLIGSLDASCELDMHIRRDGELKAYKTAGKVACELTGFEQTPVLSDEQISELKRTGVPLFVTDSPPDCKIIVYLQDTVAKNWNYTLAEGAEGVSPWDFDYIQSGEGNTFVDAIAAAIEAPKLRKPKGYDTFGHHQP